MLYHIILHDIIVYYIFVYHCLIYIYICHYISASASFLRLSYSCRRVVDTCCGLSRCQKEQAGVVASPNLLPSVLSQSVSNIIVGPETIPSSSKLSIFHVSLWCVQHCIQERNAQETKWNRLHDYLCGDAHRWFWMASVESNSLPLALGRRRRRLGRNFRVPEASHQKCSRRKKYQAKEQGRY